MEFWEVAGGVAGSLGGAAALLGVVGWLCRTVITHSLNKELEEWKAQLEAIHVKEVENLKADLERERLEHQVRFSNLHAKRAECLELLYEMLGGLAVKARQFVRPIQPAESPSKGEQLASVQRAADELDAFLAKKRILLAKATCGLIERFIEELSQSVSLASPWVTLASNPERASEVFAVIADEWLKLERKLPPITSALEEEFRNILGVSD
jgi:hypothetical protein